jgi:hypothetical protein
MSDRKPIDESQPALGVHTLLNLEKAFRARLLEAPDDITARLSLAWSLLMRAMFQAGIETVQPSPQQLENTPPSPSSARLLQDCLRQTTIVAQLGRRSQDQLEVERLLALIDLGEGGKALLAEADRARAVLQRLLSDTAQVGPELVETKPARPVH